MQAATDDLELIARLASRDQGALRALVGRYQVRVFRFVARLVRNEAIAEEITNEVFLEAWRQADRFAGRSSLATWLLSIAHNRAISELRRRREEGWDDEQAAKLVDEADNPEVATQKADKSAALRRCFDRLSPEHREIIDLGYYQELSIAECAAVLGIPEATVKTRMFYARKKLSELLKEVGIDRGWP